MGAALRRRRGRPRLADGRVVPGGLRQDVRPVRPDLLLLPDDRLHDRHLRAQLREQPAGDGADRLRGYSDDAGAGLGRRRLLHDLRLRAGAVLRHREVHLRPAAPRPARCGRGQPRREPAGGALRHRAQQHAARAVHVRRRPPRRGVEPAAGRAARRVARHCRQPLVGARAHRGLRGGGNAVEHGRRASGAGVRERPRRRDRPRGVRGDRARPHPRPHLPPHGRRRQRRAVRGHHRPQDGRGQDPPARPLRFPHRTAQPRPVPRPDGRFRHQPAPPRSVRHTLHRSRRVQAGQRYARPSLRGRVAVRRGRPPARRRAHLRHRRPLRRRRVRDPAIPARPPERGRRARRAPGRRAGRALPDQRPRGRGRRQHRHRAGATRRQQRRSAAEERRHGALSCQVGRPPGLALLRAGHGRDGAGAPRAAAGPAQRAGHRGLPDPLPAACSTCRASASRPARPCCAGRIRCAAWSRRRSSSRWPRRWG